MFLPVLEPRLPCQDYHLEQPLKTLAYAQILKYCTEKANLPGPGETCHLARGVQELRWAMKPFTTFSYHDVLEKAKPEQRAPEAQVKEAAQPGTTLTTPVPIPDTRPSTPPAVSVDESALPTV